jgi:hypothetical protein
MKKQKPMKENKQEICSLLLETLRHTRYLYDLEALRYNPDEETAVAWFSDGHYKVVNVSMDSGFSMIRDILKALAY